MRHFYTPGVVLCRVQAVMAVTLTGVALPKRGQARRTVGSLLADLLDVENRPDFKSLLAYRLFRFQPGFEGTE